MNVDRRINGEPPSEDDAALEAALAEAAAKAMLDPRYAALFVPEDDEASIARAREDVAAGRLIPHERVAAWLKTWGTPEEGPPPREWFE